MTDEYLIAMLRNNVGVSEAACRAAKAAAKAAADRIEQLIVERDAATAAAYEVAEKAVAEACVFSDDDTDGETAAKVIALGRAGKAIRALEPQPDPRDEVIARLVDALAKLRDLMCEAIEDDDGNSGCGQCENDCTGCIAHAAIAAAKAVQND